MRKNMNAEQLSASLCVFIALMSSPFAFPQDAPPQNREVNLTGVILTSDHRCSARQVKGDLLCRASDWALVSGAKTYLLFGDKESLQRFERRRVSLSGVLEEEPVIEYGMRLIRRKIEVRSIENSELSTDAIENLVIQLRVVPWRGPENHCSPKCWDFGFTDPMVKILQAGTQAQEVLLDHIGEESIKDQVVMLLGGVGDEKAIWPIIQTLTDEASDPKSNRMNLIANLALTNLTVSEVIWHHGGGISPDRCPSTPKSCWSQWWFGQENTFKVGVGGDRLYSNYPNYGIYAQFGDASPE
jgi:hypothetical protein